MEIAFIVITVIGLLITWEVVKYSHQQKKIERNGYNQSNDMSSDNQRKKSKGGTKAVKAKVSNNNKPKRSYKKKKKSVKKKTNE